MERREVDHTASATCLAFSNRSKGFFSVGLEATSLAAAAISGTMLSNFFAASAAFAFFCNGSLEELHNISKRGVMEMGDMKGGTKKLRRGSGEEGKEGRWMRGGELPEGEQASPRTPLSVYRA